MTDGLPTTEQPTDPMGPIELPSKYHRTMFELDGRAVPITITVLSMQTQLDLEAGWEALRRKPGETFTPAEDRARKLKRMQYCEAAITKYIRVKAGALVDPDEDRAPIVTGEQLVAVLGRREDVMLGLMMLILWENGVGPHERKLSKSALGSVIGWLTWVEPGDGPAPEPTATPAEPKDGQPAGDASATLDASSSTVDPLLSDAVPSGA